MSDGTERADVPPADRFTALWRRVKDHRIAQWTVGYVAVAYGIQHAVTLTSEAFKWPDNVLRISMLLLALGLPVAMTIAWYHGERAARRISTGELSIISLLLVVISFAFYVVVRPAAESSLRATAVVETGNAKLAGSALAVLPFANVSGDANQEFFSDGMTDEIMSALAKVTALRVVGRESAFEFKGKNQNDRAIGRALGARYLVEGSVRKAGERVRITAQLVRADDGVSLWTDNYDRELKDVFAVQEDVARAIAASLRVPLGLKAGASLVPNRAADLNSYQDYLRARALVRARGPAEPGGPLTRATQLLEQVVSRDPGYAPAWALLGEAYVLINLVSPTYFNASVEELRRTAATTLPKAETAARKAILLNPDNADGYTALAFVQFTRGQFVQSEDLFKQALSLDPGDPEALNEYSIQLAWAGRLKDSLVLRQRLQALEPFVPIYNSFNASVLWLNGKNDAAIALLTPLPSNAVLSVYTLAEIYAAMGRYREAADAVLMMPSGFFLPGIVGAAAQLLRTAPARADVPQKLPRLGVLGFVYLYTGAPERALEPAEDILAGGLWNAGPMLYIWHSTAAPLRRTERFKALMRKDGLVEYWRARGWPDLCHPAGTDDFECN